MAKQQETLLTSLGAALCLHPPGLCPAGSICSTATLTELWFPASAASTSLPNSLHDGCHATEMLVQEILYSAQRETAEPRQQAEAAAAAEYGTVTSATAAYPRGAVLGLSMKGSLRRFLEKRAARLRLASGSGSPYCTHEKLRTSGPPASGNSYKDSVLISIRN